MQEADFNREVGRLLASGATPNSSTRDTKTDTSCVIHVYTRDSFAFGVAERCGLFARFGEIVHVQTLQPTLARSSIHRFITYSGPEEAVEALTNFAVIMSLEKPQDSALLEKISIELLDDASGEIRNAYRPPLLPQLVHCRDALKRAITEAKAQLATKGYTSDLSHPPPSGSKEGSTSMQDLKELEEETRQLEVAVVKSITSRLEAEAMHQETATLVSYVEAELAAHRAAPTSQQSELDVVMDACRLLRGFLDLGHDAPIPPVPIVALSEAAEREDERALAKEQMRLKAEKLRDEIASANARKVAAKQRARDADRERLDMENKMMDDLGSQAFVNVYDLAWEVIEASLHKFLDQQSLYD